jgi:inhibitor of KinA
MSAGRIVALGDSCIALHLADVIDPDVNARCIALAAALEQRALPGVRDVVAAYNSVTVHFDPQLTNGETVGSELGRLADAMPLAPQGAFHTIEIPVTYGGEPGPDLAAVAEFAKCSQADVVKLHTQKPYRVYMLGFLPGFAYLGSVDVRIAMPRLETPRARVAAGSIGIAGQQTGIYPCDTPGGWRIIGRTSTRVFDAARADPFLLKPGDYVKFVST